MSKDRNVHELSLQRTEPRKVVLLTGEKVMDLQRSRTR